MNRNESDNVERRIVEVLDKVASNRHDLKNDTAWTKRIKEGLVGLGQNLGYKAYASGCDKSDGGEWLFDLCWLVLDEKRVLMAPLILECEWDRRGLMDDFPKLVLGRAQHRVMIYQAKSDKKKTDYLGEFMRAITGSSLSATGDRYLFACWDMQTKEFLYDYYVV